MSVFRLAAKRFLLTYPQCTLSKEALYEAILVMHPIKFARICIEMHEDGRPHLHAAIEFEKTLNIKNALHFDVEGFHCNIQSARNWAATLNYVKKGTDFIDFDNVEEEEDVKLHELADQLNHDDYYHECRKRKISFQYAQEAWKCKKSMFHIDSSYEPAGIIRTDLDALKLGDNRQAIKSIVIIGPTGIGKSTWAKRECLKPALFVTHMDGLKALTSEHRSIIFDDMSFTHIHREAQIAIVDRFDPRQLHARYTTADIPAGIEKIFTANEPIFGQDAAVMRRCETHIFK